MQKRSPKCGAFANIVRHDNLSHLVCRSVDVRTQLKVAQIVLAVPWAIIIISVISGCLNKWDGHTMWPRTARIRANRIKVLHLQARKSRKTTTLLKAAGLRLGLWRLQNVRLDETINLCGQHGLNPSQACYDMHG